MKNNLENWKQALLETALVLTWSSGFIGAIMAAKTESVLQANLCRFVFVGLLLMPATRPVLMKKPPPAW